MKYNCIFHLIVILSLLFLIKTKDYSTLSNYEKIKLTKLTGLFVPDFERKIVNGSLTYTFSPIEEGNEIILDTKYLDIISVEIPDSEETIEFKLDEENEDENFGVPLIIYTEYKPDKEVILTISYTTTEDGSAVSFLEKEQTMGGDYEYFFTMSECILGRELLPSQDTPAVKFTFELGIKVPKPLRGMISGLHQNTKDNDDGTQTFYYKQEIPIPNYLIALAAGNIEEKPINNNISVYSEPVFVEKVYEELKNFLPDILEKTISYLGDYEWGKYNVLVLPNSFPYSGMENPSLTFSSPCLINGDKSLVDIVAHELIHSWSGNLVTNENWRDFWLNEGITMFLQRKIIGMWKDEDYAKMDAILGTFYIAEYLEYFGADSTHTSLRPNLTDKNPDDYYSDIPYEKGYNFMYYLETLIGNDTMKDFFRSYFAYFKYKSLDFDEFKDYFLSFCKNNSITNETLNEIDWDKWIYEPGDCPIKNDFTNRYMTEVDQFLDKFDKEEFDDGSLKEEFNKWMHTSKTVFMNTLEQRYDFLTKKQHDFLTKDLKLYDVSQNFLVKTNYFRLILAKTDEFYDIEKEYLIKYLSSYGALDYMTGIYGLFYRRDEVLANETLQNLSTFYHPLMINVAEEEFADEEKYFPILTLDLKEENRRLNLSNKEEETIENLEIITEGYKSNHEPVEILKGIFLENNEKKINLKCLVKHSEKYCTLEEEIKICGEYHLNAPNRVQNQTYAIRKNNGKNTIEVFRNENEIEYDEKNNKKEYKIKYDKSNKTNIEIFFLSKPDENIQVIYKENQLNCTIKNKSLDCIIDKDTFKPGKKYTLNVTDLCGKEKYNFNIKIEEDDDDDDKIGTVAILFIIIAGLFIIVIVSFFIYRSVNKNKSVNIEQVQENKLLSDI